MTSDFKTPRVKFKYEVDTGGEIQLNEISQSVLSVWDMYLCSVNIILIIKMMVVMKLSTK